jgi:hypothetical protein
MFTKLNVSLALILLLNNTNMYPAMIFVITFA